MLGGAEVALTGAASAKQPSGVSILITIFRRQRMSRKQSCYGASAVLLLAGVVMIASGSTAVAGPVFNTFISAADLNAVEGQDNVIAINYAGNKFVGSVYS